MQCDNEKASENFEKKIKRLMCFSITKPKFRSQVSSWRWLYFFLIFDYLDYKQIYLINLKTYLTRYKFAYAI